MKTLSALTEDQLASRIRRLTRLRKNALVQLVFCLAELHRRRVHVAAGHPTLADYCRRVLGEDRHKAWRLGRAAEAVATYPLAADLLGSGNLSFSALVAVKPALTWENHEELLRAAIGLTEEEAEVLASTYQPRPRRNDAVRVVHQLEPQIVAPPTERPTVASAPQNVELVLVERYEIRATVSKDVRDLLDEVKLALSHKVPDGNLNDVLAECFRLTLAARERQRTGSPRPAGDGRTVLGPSAAVEPSASERCGTVAEPSDGSAFDAPNVLGPSSTEDRSRYIPVAVRRAVWARDGGCCSFRANDGTRCGSKYQVEFDHWRAFALGGEHAISNVRLLCSHHNRFEAERVLGRALMRKYFDRPRPAGRQKPVSVLQFDDVETTP